MGSQEVVSQEVIKLKALLTIANEHISILATAVAKQKAGNYPGCCLCITMLDMAGRQCKDGRTCAECNKHYLAEYTKSLIEVYTVKVD